MIYRNRKTTTIQKEEMIKLYQDGKSLSEIGKIYGINYKSVADNLERRGIKRRNYSDSQQKYKINQNYFNRIDSHEKAQILGMLYADGCNMIEHGELNLTLQDIDISYVEWVSRCMESNKPLRFIPSTHNGRRRAKLGLRINNKKICEDLVTLGCFPRKSLTLRFPTESQVPIEFMSSFVLGFFEGDGSIMAEENKKLSFACSESFAQGLKTFLVEKFGHHLGIYPNTPRTCFSVSTQKPLAIFTILDWAYSKAPFRMERKYLRFLRIKEQLSIPPAAISHDD